MNTPYPAELRIVPRRRRPWAAWLAFLAVAALAVTAFAWAPRGAQPARSAAVAHRPPKAAPPVRVTVGRVSYSCTVIPPKPKR